METHAESIIIQELLESAITLGATRAARIAPEIVKVEDSLAANCKEPRCPNFGQSPSCPPYVKGPAWFREKLSACKHVLVLRLEIDSESLHGEDRHEVMRLLHQLTAAVELKAKDAGYTKAMGFAGGSCKMSFCKNLEQCRVLAGDDNCLFPDQARQSMSGFGVNVGELMKAAGWTNDLFSPDTKTGHRELAWVAGMVLLSW